MSGAFVRAKTGAHVWTGSPRGVCGFCYKCRRRMRKCCCYEDRQFARDISEHVNMFAETNLSADHRSSKLSRPLSGFSKSLRRQGAPLETSAQAAEATRQYTGEGAVQKDELNPHKSEDGRKLSLPLRGKQTSADPSAGVHDAFGLEKPDRSAAVFADTLRAPDALETSSGLEAPRSNRVPSRFGQRPQTATGSRASGTGSAHLTTSYQSTYRNWKEFDFLREPRASASRDALPASGAVPGQPARPLSAMGSSRGSAFPASGSGSPALSASRGGARKTGYSYRPMSWLRREGRARGEYYGVNDCYDGARPFGGEEEEEEEEEEVVEQAQEEEEEPTKEKVDDLVRQLRVLCYRKVRCGGGDVSVREIFRRFDANKDTSGGDIEHQGIDLQEFKDAMKRLMLGNPEEGMITDKQAQHLFMRLDKDHDGTIDFRETAMSLSLPGWDNKVLGRKSNILL